MKTAAPFDTILFDLGGVIIDLDISRSLMAFTTSGIPNVDNWFVLKNQAELLNQFEKGIVDEDEFILQVCAFSNQIIPSDHFISCWNAMLGEIPLHRVEMLDDLRSRYRVLALSNINSIHEKGCNAILSASHQREAMADLFHEVYYSHKINERKPDASCFEKTIALSGLVPERTLFFDDGKANVETALSLGFQAFHVDKDITELMQEIGAWNNNGR